MVSFGFYLLRFGSNQIGNFFVPGTSQPTALRFGSVWFSLIWYRSLVYFGFCLVLVLASEEPNSVAGKTVDRADDDEVGPAAAANMASIAGSSRQQQRRQAYPFCFRIKNMCLL